MKPEPTEADKPWNCPKCGVNLLAGPVPDKYLEHYGQSRYYKREIGFYDMNKDRTVYHVCPDCKEKI